MVVYVLSSWTIGGGRQNGSTYSFCWYLIGPQWTLVVWRIKIKADDCSIVVQLTLWGNGCGILLFWRYVFLPCLVFGVWCVFFNFHRAVRTNQTILDGSSWMAVASERTNAPMKAAEGRWKQAERVGESLVSGMVSTQRFVLDTIQVVDLLEMHSLQSIGGIFV